MDREILGIDHGNRQMKTANTAFLSTVTQNKVKTSNLSQILEFKGKYYSIGGSREDVDTKVDKTVDDDYYIPVSYTHLWRRKRKTAFPYWTFRRRPGSILRRVR